MNNVDGWIAIGTKLDTKQLENDLKSEETKLKKYTKENEVLINAKVKIEKSKAMKEYQQLKDAIERAYDNKIQLAQQDKYIGYEKTIEKYNIKKAEEVQKLNEAYSEQLSKIEEINKQLAANNYQEALTKDNIDDINKKLTQSRAVDNVKDKINSIGNATENITKKVGRWALAVFGIRSIYMGIRNAINMISMQDEKLAADINYLKTALAYTLEPIVRAIVELMKQIVFYIGYIIKAWTGRDIFARANKNLKSAAKSAKQLKKELTTAGFDEMNILNDTSSSGGGSTSSPSFNLSDMEAPKWLQWIVKNKKPLLAIISGLTAGILAWKLGLKAIKSLGIGIAVAGLVYAIESLIDFLKDPAFENFIKILEGITVAVIGVAVAIAAWPVALAAAVALIVVELVKHFDEIKGLFNKLLDWMDKNFLGTLKNLFGPLGEILYAPFEAVVKMVKTLFESFYGGIKQIIEGIVKIFNGDFLGGIKDIFGGLLNVLLAPFNALVEGVKTVIGRLKTFFGDLLTWMKDKFISPLTSKLGGIINKLKDILGLQQKTNVTGGGGAGSFGGGTSGGRAMGGIFYPSLLPKLAVGGIINNPGAGVPYHGAVIGERGAEAVVPLTQSEQMELLGESIGRYVTINATIPVYAYNRQVDRQIQIIRAEDDFASNR